MVTLWLVVFVAASASTDDCRQLATRSRRMLHAASRPVHNKKPAYVAAQSSVFQMTRLMGLTASAKPRVALDSHERGGVWGMGTRSGYEAAYLRALCFAQQSYLLVI